MVNTLSQYDDQATDWKIEVP